MTPPTENDRKKAVELATVIVESDAVTAIAAVAQALANERDKQREEDAKKCEALEGDGSKPSDRIIGYRECAAAIRAEKGQP